MKRIILLLLMTPMLNCFGQDLTDVSLFFKRGDKHQIDSVSSKKGNLFHKLGHHGPAIENQWYALRFYFDKRTAIDVYSKQNPGLELREKGWYPSKKEQLEGWGADYYKAGKTAGLGGVRLWDGEKVVPLDPVTKRMARVIRTSDSSYMEMVSEGIPYLGEKVDVSVRVTVYDTTRLAKVNARSLSGKQLHFACGINYFENLEIEQNSKFIASWGQHPEDIAAEKVNVGAALLIPDEGIQEWKKLEEQFILITEPSTNVSFSILSANEREPNMNSFKDFIRIVENIINE